MSSDKKKPLVGKQGPVLVPYVTSVKGAPEAIGVIFQPKHPPRLAYVGNREGLKAAIGLHSTLVVLEAQTAQEDAAEAAKTEQPEAPALALVPEPEED